MTMVFAWVMLYLSQACLAGVIHKTGLSALVVQDKSIVLTNSSSSKTITQSSGSIVSVQYYTPTGSLYFLHQRELRIQTLDSTKSQRVLTFPQSMTITDLALDPQTGYLFWTDSLNQTIYISKLGEYIKPVVQFGKEYKVLDIQLDTSNMWLFVSVRVGSVTQIYRFDYNGANKRLLHHFSTTNSCIAVDSANKRLYLADKYKPYVNILSYSPPTTELRPRHLTREIHATSISVSNNTLYLTGSRIAGVLAVAVQSGEETVLLQQFGSLRDTVLLEPMSTAPSLCANASCPQLCTVAHLHGEDTGGSSPAARCFCSEGYRYDEEQRYCVLEQDGISGPLFVCLPSARVVSLGARCDGVNDCWDNSDETGCTSSCKGFVCPSDKTCIPSSSLCNSIPECEQGEDELCCHDNVTCCRDNVTCTCDDVTEWRCSSGECVRGSGRCDGVQDCADRSDELRCAEERRGEDTFKCTVSQEYIPGTWECDGRYDCSDFSDEAYCLGGGCNSTQITCDEGRCLDSQYVCDGVLHCKDMTDEITCPNTTCQIDYLPCGNGTCLSAELFCNGAADCGDETDEQCDFEKLLCSNTEFMCDSASCIPAGWQCDGKVDCSGGEDELGCPADDTSSSCDDCTCQSDDDCSQSCVSGKCVCHQGYTLSSADNMTCTADTPARVYFLSGHQLYYSNLQGGSVSVPKLLQLQNISLISTFDVVVDTGVIIAASGTQIYTISSPNGGESTAELLIKRQLGIACIAVDWINSNIYWVEAGTLMMSNTQYTGLKTLTQDVADVALDAKYNSLYYSTTAGSLIRCILDMSECSDISPSDQVVYLYIDQVSRYIYYTARNTSISRLDMSGTSHLIANSTTLGNVTLGHIIYFESNVYYFTQSDLHSYHRQSGGRSPVTLQLVDGSPLTPTQIAVSHASLQPTTSQRPCAASLCPQLCTQATPGTSTCLCSDLYSLSDRACRYTGEECIAELKCDDRGCLQEESQRCDGFSDCYDASDERYCNTECLSEEFMCGVGGCIHSSLRCDASQECIDGSDEMNCTGSCDTGFLCATGQCINSKLHCNRHDDCGDNSDETVELCEHIPCPPDLFECQPNQCIPNSFVCNGYTDCANGSDEAECSSDHCAISCDARESGEARCYPLTARCNGVEDCDDGTDEAGCKENNTCHELEFRCKDGSGCISLVMRCDGVPQCTDRSDEQTCDKCKDGYTECDNGHCVHPRYRCDGIWNCALGEDEVDCAECTDQQISCDGICLPNMLVCDGEVDCLSGRDEADCSYPVCLPSQFMCSSGSCIERHYRCDGSADCIDNSDEMSCSKCALSSYLCDTGLCLSQELVCDGKDDCGDESDEQGCDQELINECSSRPCDLEHGQCVDLRLGYYCKCDPGYQLARNMKFCIDADECDLLTQPRQCSQQCINTEGSYVCACYKNFSLDRRDQVTCEPHDPLSFLLLSYHTLFLLSRVFPDYYNLTREVILFGVPGTVHALAAHFTSTTSALLYTAEGSSIRRYAKRDNSSPVLDDTWTSIRNVHVSSLAVDWITGNLYWSDPVLGQIKFLPSHSTTRPISLLTTFCDKARGLVLLPGRGKMYFIHVYGGVPGITEAALDGSRRLSVTGRGEVVSHFDIDEVTTTLYYITPKCDSRDAPCLYKRELKHANHQSTLLNINLPEHITAFKVFASHGYLATGTKEILKCKLYADMSCSQFNALQPHISNILILSPITQPAHKNACGDDAPCADDTVCVNVPVDALGVQLQPSCICKHSRYFYDSTSKKCRAEKTKCDPEMYFPCRRSGCVELRFRCDGIADCSDGSDEAECNEHSCNHLMQFSCRSGHQCVPIERQCDGFSDCSDNSDETSCNGSLCDGTKFFCPGTKTCIPMSWVCDGTVDCHHGNGEDEVGCEGEVKCPFRCSNNAKNQECFPEIIVGDGKADCYYGEDEEMSGRECEEGLFQCGSFCYPDSWKCDVEGDCEKDERSCRVSSRPCPQDQVPTGGPDSQRCISTGLVCDGWPDLPDGRDELNCLNITCDTSSFIRCEGLCVPAEWRCDGYCDSLNLIGCPCDPTQRNCGHGQCIDSAHWCDGDADCRTGIDEEWCPESECDHTSFQCSYSGRCLRGSVGLCDGANDCLDGSDEEFCPQITYEQCTANLYDCKTSEPLEDRCVGETTCNNATAHQQAVCTNKRDIMRCNQGDPCQGNGGCAHVCSALPDGTRQCRCYRGYVLDSDGRTCRDVNECKNPNTCSQVCENLKGSYTCSCLAGFVKSGNDGSSCIPASGPPEILISTEFDMRTSTSRSYTTVTSGSRRSFKFAFYAATNGKYYFVVGLVGRYTLQTLSPDGTTGEIVVDLDGEVHDVQYNPLTHNIVYCNTHSVNILSLTSILATTVDTNIHSPVHRLALSPRFGKIFYIRDWKLGVMDSNGRSTHYLVAGSPDYWTYQFKDGRILALSVDEPAKRIYWYNVDLQQLSSATYSGARVTTVVNRLKHVQQIVVHGDQVFWHTAKYLWEVNKRNVGGVKGRVREWTLPKCSHISVVSRDPAVLPECKECVKGICRIVEGSGPVCTGNHDNKTCTCENNGKCVRSDNGDEVCLCNPGYSGISCTIGQSNNAKYYLFALGFLAFLVLIATTGILYRRKYSFSTIKNFSSNLLRASTIRYSRQANSVSIDNVEGTNNNSTSLGIVNRGCEEYDLEEITTDHSQLIEGNFEEDVI